MVKRLTLQDGGDLPRSGGFNRLVSGTPRGVGNEYSLFVYSGDVLMIRSGRTGGPFAPPTAVLEE